MGDYNYLCAVCADSLIMHKSKGSDVNANAWYYQVRNRFLLIGRLNGAQREERKKQVINNATVVAEEARRAGNSQGWLAIACAVYDGLQGRFGKRPDSPALLLPSAYLASRTLYSHLRDKWRTIRQSQYKLNKL